MPPRGFHPTRKFSTGWCKVPPAVPFPPAVSFGTRVSARMNPPLGRDSLGKLPLTSYLHCASAGGKHLTEIREHRPALTLTCKIMILRNISIKNTKTCFLSSIALQAAALFVFVTGCQPARPAWPHTPVHVLFTYTPVRIHGLGTYNTQGVMARPHQPDPCIRYY